MQAGRTVAVYRQQKTEFKFTNTISKQSKSRLSYTVSRVTSTEHKSCFKNAATLPWWESIRSFLITVYNDWGRAVH